MSRPVTASVPTTGHTARATDAYHSALEQVTAETRTRHVRLALVDAHRQTARTTLLRTLAAALAAMDDEGVEFEKTHQIAVRVCATTIQSDDNAYNAAAFLQDHPGVLAAIAPKVEDV